MGSLVCRLVTKARRPRGPMDKASAYGAGDCRFESCRGHLSDVMILMGGAGKHAWIYTMSPPGVE